MRKSSGKSTSVDGKGFMIRKKGTDLYSQGGAPKYLYNRGDLNDRSFVPPEFGPKEKGKIWTANALGTHLAQYRKRNYQKKTLTLEIPEDWEIIPVEVLIIERGEPFNALEYIRNGKSHKHEVVKASIWGYREEINGSRT